MLYGLTIFLSAFLLFQVQLVLGKHLLPWFGGTPTVWATCFVFFQSVLVAGYAYAHGVARLPRRRDQGRVHAMFLLAGLAPLVVFALTAGLPLLPPAVFKPGGDEVPLSKLLPALALCGGLPFFVLSATSPLLQSWHSRKRGEARDTYRLYALSNAGSLLGLISYPFFFEWMFDLQTQAWIWSGLFIVFAAGCLAVALRGGETAGDVLPEAAPPSPPSASTRPALLVLALWIFLPFASTALLVAVTNHLTQDVAPVPLLWMLPLVIYLLTFIICFDRPHWYSRRLVTTTALCTVAILATLHKVFSLGFLGEIPLFGAFLFLFALVCHGELVRLRPSPERLTQFYLAIALGGALGGAFVGLFAPMVFPDVWELKITILLGWVLFVVAMARDRRSPFYTGDGWQCTLVIAATLFGLFRAGNGWLGDAGFGDSVDTPQGVLASAAGSLCAAIVSSFLPWVRRARTWFAWPCILASVVLIAAGDAVRRTVTETRADEFIAGRNFFGVLRVALWRDPEQKIPPIVRLQHGSTWHGSQILDEEQRRRPTTYYTRDSGVGLAARLLLRRQAGHEVGEYPGVNIGALGLGVGTIAAYAETGDRVRFYEINPHVAVLSKGEAPVFTYLDDSAGDIRIVFGDARISLERELTQGNVQQFDLLVLDVFSGDAIPTHLLTSEAFDLYRAHLRDEHSIIAVHISSRYLDLEPVVMAQAKRLGMDAARFETISADEVTYSSTWMLLVRNPAFFAHPDVAAVAVEPIERTVEFTDRFSNLLQILKW